MRVIVWDVMGVVLQDTGLNLELISLVQRIRKTGVPCVLGTNLSSQQATRMWEELGLNKHFDEIFASSRLGAWKPEPEFFAGVQHELDVLYDSPAPEKVLFVDDSRDNVFAANAFGWQSVQYTSFEQILEVLKDSAFLGS